MNFKDEQRKHPPPITLRTKPSQILVFSFVNPLDLYIFNENSFSIIFKLKTTEPDILISQPARGFIPSQSFVQCSLTPLQKRSPISLVIQYAQIGHSSNDYFTQWKCLKSENIFLKKYQCLFDQSSSRKATTLIKPMILTFATMTLLTTLIYWRNK